MGYIGDEIEDRIPKAYNVQWELVTLRHWESYESGQEWHRTSTVGLKERANPYNFCDREYKMRYKIADHCWWSQQLDSILTGERTCMPEGQRAGPCFASAEALRPCAHREQRWNSFE